MDWFGMWLRGADSIGDHAASPARGVVRRATRDVDLGGRTIPAGALVLVALAGANRDACAFAAPDRLSLNRPAAPRHVAFGYGNHACLGLQLARAEARIALETLIARRSDVRFDEEQVQWLRNDFLAGPVQLNPRFRPMP